MKYRRKLWTGLAAAVSLIILILDAKTALVGAKEGVLLCINTVVPSLFPFFILSSVINSIYMGNRMRLLRPIGKICGIPEGGESLLLLGFLGGYPVGAQSIEEAYNSNSIDKATARRLLGFCSNAGPAFIFGMLGGLFPSGAVLWCLWGIHIISALIVGILLPGKAQTYCRLARQETVTFPTAVEKSLKTMARVCSWVILFRIILTFVQRWFLWPLPREYQVIFAGVLELSNGCLSLYDLPKQGLRYVLSAGFLSFGGICVAMQTVSVTKSAGIGYYFPGKILQMLLSVILALVSQHLLFDISECISVVWWPLLLLSAGVICLYLNRIKKVVAIPG